MQSHAAVVPELETRRLVLRPLTLDDAPQIQEVFPDWRIVEFLGSAVPWPYPADGAESFIRNVVLPARSEGSGWHWSLRLKEATNRVVGVINLRSNDDENRGFWLHPELWGRGLMTEACDIVTEFWFETLNKEVLRVPKAVDNLASRKISERSGMRMVERLEHDFVSGRKPAEIWEITREEWRQRPR